MNGRMMRRYGHSFISYNKSSMHLIHLVGKMTLCGTRIAYIYVRTPNSNKGSFGIADLSSRRELMIFKNLPHGQEGFFFGWP
jgi:hypothetical protein